MSTVPRVIACLTSHNRREHTLAALASLEASASAATLAPMAVLVDDNSHDGTPQAVRERFPWVDVRHGDGTLFWCRGMHRAIEIAQARRPDFVLWLNDDTVLRVDALSRLLDAHAQLCGRSGGPVLVVGTTVDPLTQQPSYGGERRVSTLRPLRFALVPPGPRPARCDAMNGNIVLVSAEAAARVGNLDPTFEHAMGDTDYALRANARGVTVWAAPGVHGECRGNDRGGTFADPSLPLRTRWRSMTSRKGLPPRSWRHFARRHAGWLWPAYFAWPYLRVLLGGMLPPARRRT